MKAQGLARIGRDVELRKTGGGESVAGISLAFTFGRKGEDGNRPTQWVDASLWGKRAEVLAPYLTKGSQVVAYLEDVHIQTYEGKNGQGSKLVARVADIELISGQERQEAPRQEAPRQEPRRQEAPKRALAEMDDDIPW